MRSRATGKSSTGAAVRCGSGPSRGSTSTWQVATGRSELERPSEGCRSRDGSARGLGYSH